MMNFPRRTYNFTLEVLEPCFEKQVVGRVVTFSKVTVNDSNGNNYLELRCGLNVANETAPEVQSWMNGTLPNFGFVIKDEHEDDLPGNGQLVFEAASFEGGGDVILKIWYDRSTVDVVVNATDPVMGGVPICGLNVTVLGTKSTNENGVATWNYPPSSTDPLGAFPVFTSCAGNSTFGATNVTVVVDSRWETCLTSLDGEVAEDLPVNDSVNLYFRLSCPPRNENLSGVHVDFYFDAIDWEAGPVATGVTGADGVVPFSWTFTENRTSIVYADFGGLDPLWDPPPQMPSYSYYEWYKDCNVSMAAVVSSIPLGVEFGVSRKELLPNDLITLNATLMDLRFNDTRYSEYSCNVNFTEVNPYGTVTNSCVAATNNDGVAQLGIKYPNDGLARAYKALIVSANGTPQNVVSSMVQLSVGKTTRLLLNVTRDFNSTRHVFNAKLVYGSFLVPNKTIKLRLNETEYTGITDSNGLAQIVLWLSPQQNNNQTLFTVVASFEGDASSVAKASMALPNGTIYDVCTTIQYNSFKPSTNSTSITVRPQKTEGATTLMNQEQMQTDAGSKGLEVWGPDSFSIFPPFLKFHARVGIGSLGMDVHEWIGLCGWGIDNSAGLGRLLQDPLLSLPPEVTSVVASNIIYAITVTAALYVTTQIAVTFTKWTPAYIATLLLYLGAGLGILTGFFLIPDANIAKALLYGVGFALLAMLIGALSADAFTKLVHWTIQSEITGGEIVYTAVKGIINSFIGIAIASQFMNLFFVDPLLIPFAIETAILAAYAIWLGSIKA
jgi:hypothetical protein